ncbi:MAG TPA: class I SAM-dependent methyltransferase [Gammaproteobacteria bacterium]|nr:class I SAM-dependent methyltransferase [Gammaproteobacteria bacterium]
MSDDPPLKHSFGFQQVDADERRRRIRHVFEVVAPRYDLMNDFMSFGIHRLWKRSVARQARPSAGQTIVDLAGGTGDVARLLAAPDREVLLVDPSLPMMRAGRRKGLEHIRLLAASGEALPLADASVDTLTIAFGIRNMTDMEAALAEIHRVLRPGGRCLCLEFSRPLALIRPLYHLYSFLVIPRLGARVARQPAAYTYLVESIRRFPDQEEMKALMLQAGFERVRYRNYSLGIACLHLATKAG